MHCGSCCNTCAGIHHNIGREFICQALARSGRTPHPDRISLHGWLLHLGGNAIDRDCGCQFSAARVRAVAGFRTQHFTVRDADGDEARAPGGRC